MKIWITSDSHFSHKNIIEYCSRPFTDVEQMNEHLVDAWNSCVRDGDIVLHLGDVAMGRPCDSEPALRRLNGRKVLVHGNHDSKRHMRLYASLGWSICERLIVDDVLLQHRYLPDDDHGFELVLHGHAHGTQHARKKHIDVGVDAARSHGYAPIDAGLLMSRSQLFALRAALNFVLRRP